MYVSRVCTQTDTDMPDVSAAAAAADESVSVVVSSARICGERERVSCLCRRLSR